MHNSTRCSQVKEQKTMTDYMIEKFNCKINRKKLLQILF